MLPARLRTLIVDTVERFNRRGTRPGEAWARGLALAVGLVFVSAASAATRYTIVDLGDLAGGDNYSRASGINAQGQVVGSSNTANGDRAFLWTAGTGMQNLGLVVPGGTGYSEATGLNSSGQVVGYAGLTAYPGTGAFRWTAAGGMQYLGTLPNKGSMAAAINDNGQVAGHCEGLPDQALLWDAANCLQDLTPLTGITNTRANGINANGQIALVNTSDNGTTWQGYRWSAGGGLQSLGDLAGGTNFTWASGINASGLVTGYSNSTSGDRAFLWSESGGMQNLGRLSGGNYSRADAINSLVQVVGISGAATGPHAFLWSGSDGLLDLNDFVDWGGQGWISLMEATAINDVGQIAGYGTTVDVGGQHVQHAFLLTPVPEPGTAAVVGMGGVLLLLRRRGARGTK